MLQNKLFARLKNVIVLNKLLFPMLDKERLKGSHCDVIFGPLESNKS